MEENQNDTSQEYVVEVNTPLIQNNGSMSGTEVVPESAPINNSVPMNNDAPMNNKEPKKKGKILPIIIGIVVVILILAGAGYFYLKSQRSASKYIDTKLAEVKNSLEESFENDTINSVGTLDLFSEDIIADGNIKIKTNGETLKMLNGTELSYKLKGAFGKEYAEANLNLKDSSTSVEGTVFLNSKDIYLDIKDITPSLLKMESSENIFAEIKSQLEEAELDSMKELLDIKNLKDFSLKTIDFLAESLKETVSSTKQKGLNIEYVYEFNNDTLVKALNKYMELAKNDNSYSDLIKKITNMDDITFDTSEIDIKDKLIVTIEVNMLSNKMENLTIVFNDKTILSKVGEDQYKLLFDNDNDENYAIITIKDDEVKFVVFNENTEYLTVDLISKKKEVTLNIEIKPMSISASVNVKEISKNETKMTINADLAIAQLELETTIKASGNKISADGSLTANISAQILGGTAESITVDFSINYEHGKDIVSKASLSNAKSIDQLTESDYESMNSKLESKLEESTLLSYLESLFMISYDDNYFDDYDEHEWDDGWIDYNQDDHFIDLNY